MSELFLETIQGEIPAKFPAGMPEETQPYGKPKSHIPALLLSFSNVGMGGKSWECSWEFLEVTGSPGMSEFGGNPGMREQLPWKSWECFWDPPAGLGISANAGIRRKTGNPNPKGAATFPPCFRAFPTLEWVGRAGNDPSGVFFRLSSFPPGSGWKILTGKIRVVPSSDARGKFQRKGETWKFPGKGSTWNKN